MAQIITTRPLPTTIAAECAAGADAQLSRIPGLGWIIHPADYDPALITAEDVLQDGSLRRLTTDEEYAADAAG